MPSICDFCSLPHVSSHYHTNDFGITTADHIFPDAPILTIHGLPYVATEDIHPVRGVGHMAGTQWLACDECAKFIDSKDVDALIRHVMATWVHTQSIPPGTTEEGFSDSLKQFYAAFFHQLTGVREAWAPAE